MLYRSNSLRYSDPTFRHFMEQRLFRVIRQLFLTLVLTLSASLVLAEGSSLLNVSYDAVSYTHLDVYKRQV